MYDTSILDEALAHRREQWRRQQSELLGRVLQTLQAHSESLGIEDAYVVGSLKTPGAWHSASDVDVAVRGRGLDVLEVMKVLEAATGRQVNVIDLDRHPSAARFIASGLKVLGHGLFHSPRSFFT